MRSSELSRHRLLRSECILSLDIYMSLVTIVHLLSQLSSTSDWAILEPRMCKNVRDGQSVGGIVTKHGCHKIRELSAVAD